jgi:hypothetical protein
MDFEQLISHQSKFGITLCKTIETLQELASLSHAITI